MLKMSAVVAVSLDHRPFVRQYADLGCSFIYHRLNADCHSRYKSRTSAGLAEVRNFGILVHLVSYSVTDELPYHIVAS